MLLKVIGGQRESAHHAERLLIGVHGGLLEIQVRDRGERLHVLALAVIVAVKAAGHEVPAAAFGEQAAFGHLDAEVAGHQPVGVLDGPVSLWVGERFAVAVLGDAIESL